MQRNSISPTISKQVILLILIFSLLVGCSKSVQEAEIPTALVAPVIKTAPDPATVPDTAPIIATSMDAANPVDTESEIPAALSLYAFPKTIDPAKRYLFYLHGKIIEDQGIPAISPDYGEYEYLAILKTFREYGFVVLSEQRARDTDGYVYADRIAGQARILLEAGVPAGNITIVGASKGAGIAIFVSHLLKEKSLRYVIMAICDPATIAQLKQDQVYLTGSVLSLYDAADEFAGSCQELFEDSEAKGLARHEEIVLNVGSGHGILYKPLEAWIVPVVQWAFAEEGS